MTNPAHCRKAIKILEQFERLAQKLEIQISPARIARLRTLRDTGEIKFTDLPGLMRRKFPGEFAGLTLSAIRRACEE